jgi:gliding motility-associated-like protein
MKRGFLPLVIFFFWSLSAFATHQRAAEITYKHIEGLTYEFTITMYTRTSSPADDTRTFMPILWGDNTIDELPRIIWDDWDDDISLNVYKGTHTFPGPGTYIISTEDPNRNNGVVNIPNSVNVPIYVESILVINPFLGYNNSTQLLNPPIDKACVGKIFIHNPAAYDPDGDSLSYKLKVCKGAAGYDIPGYTFPMASDVFKLDSVSGNLIWRNPMLQGEYNVAFVVEEWRNGNLIGTVRRDMQITVVACDHDPPEIDVIDDTCEIAGNFLSFPVSATDPEGTNVTITAFGGPFNIPESPAKINPDPGTGSGTAYTTFEWPTKCSHIRNKAYNIVFKAEDNGYPVNLVNFKTTAVSVIGPPPENLTVEALGNGINLSWDKEHCTNATGYKIYRHVDSSYWDPGFCETGVPYYTGFRLIKTINGINTTTFRDTNLGDGLNHGIRYCYRVTATFHDDAESLASNEACTFLKRDVPIITHVTNDSIDILAGRVKIIWAKPTELDQVQYPGPYQYTLYRNNGISWNDPIQITVLDGLDDTTWMDASVNMNTNDRSYSYRVDLSSKTVGFIDSSQDASSIFLTLHPFNKALRLSWTFKVPWVNEKYVIYKKNKISGQFEAIDTTANTSYFDKGLENHKEYCYYIRAIGHYSVPGIIDPLINFSQIACGEPDDKEPPCKPLLWIETDCDNSENKLTWSLPYDTCNYDVAKYVIYYSQPGPDNIAALDSITDPFDTTYVHNNLDNVVGCYGVIAVDSVGNRSEMSDITCVNYDACPACELPNVFTPNDDNFNDLLRPLTKNPKATVDHIELSIFNRWGVEVFYTEDPEVKWDGKNQKSGKLLPDGTYFYKCTAHVITNEGLITTHLQGSVTIITGNR